MKENWKIKNVVGDFEEIAKEFHVTEQTARLLVNRGYKKKEEITAYLYPTMSDLTSETLLPDVDIIVSKLSEAIEQQMLIRIFGDYDVDGVTATFLCMKALRELGANCDYRIPDRKVDGYGISERMVKEAISDGVQVVLTVDNGVVAVSQTVALRAAGITVLITDHHEPQSVLPRADALCDPKLPNAPARLEICGAVVAAKVMNALWKYYGKTGFLEAQMDILALATICDVMPLVGENRSIVKLGIAKLKKDGNFGLNRLLEVCSVSKDRIDTYTFGFQLGPCVNALGRLETADAGVELLLSEDMLTADSLAKKMFAVNTERKQQTDDQEKLAMSELSEEYINNHKVIVCYLPDCHESIAGIVAGRVRKYTNRPTIVLTNSEDSEILKGSARSIDGVSIFELLCKCKDLLVKFGGHDLAAGLSLKKSELEPLRQRLQEVSDFSDEFLIPTRMIDIQLPLHLLTEQMIQEISLLEPFGKGNAEPLFVLRNANITKLYLVGKSKQFWKFQVYEPAFTTDRSTVMGRDLRMEGISFMDSEALADEFSAQCGEELLRRLSVGNASTQMHILYTPSVNDFNGVRRLEFRVEGYRFVQNR